MKLNKLDKATKIYKAIQELDEEIIKIEKRANDLANGNFEVTTKFTFKSLDPKADKVKFDEDGSIVQGDRPSGLFSFSFIISGEPSKKEDTKDVLEIKVGEKEALYMIGALLSG